MHATKEHSPMTRLFCAISTTFLARSGFYADSWTAFPWFISACALLHVCVSATSFCETRKKSSSCRTHAQLHVVIQGIRRGHLRLWNSQKSRKTFLRVSLLKKFWNWVFHKKLQLILSTLHSCQCKAVSKSLVIEISPIQTLFKRWDLILIQFEGHHIFEVA